MGYLVFDSAVASVASASAGGVVVDWLRASEGLPRSSRGGHRSGFVPDRRWHSSDNLALRFGACSSSTGLSAAHCLSASHSRGLLFLFPYDNVEVLCHGL